MLEAALAFIPLLAGYLLVSTWHATRYLIKREDSQKVYFRAAFWGIWLFLLGTAVTHFAEPAIEPALLMVRSWDNQAILVNADHPRVDTAFWMIVLLITLTLGMVGGFLLNWLFAFTAVSRPELVRLAWRRYKHGEQLLRRIYEQYNRKVLKLAIHKLNADLEILLMRALELGMPVCITLDHGKVYVGYVTGAIRPGDSRDVLRILPFVSGYRADKDHTITFTTWYVALYQQYANDESLSHQNPERFEVALPLSEIKSISLFDIKVYNALQEEAHPAHPSPHPSGLH